MRKYLMKLVLSSLILAGSFTGLAPKQTAVIVVCQDMCCDSQCITYRRCYHRLSSTSCYCEPNCIGS